MTNKIAGTILCVSLVTSAADGLLAQPAPLAFEVASIQPSAPDSPRELIDPRSNGDLRVMNQTLKMLVTLAYDVHGFQVLGGPSWINSQPYDILAKAGQPGESAGPLPDASMRQRLRTLLAERFNLAIHRETKDAPVYALVVGKNGSRLQPAREGVRRGIRFGRDQITAQGMPLQMMVNILSNLLERPVLDQTGLKGNFDFKLEWTPDFGQSGPFGGSPPGVDAPSPRDPNGPSLFTAIQEQLGLRLESQRGPMEMIVVDGAEKPSEN